MSIELRGQPAMPAQYVLVLRGGICVMPAGRVHTDTGIRAGEIVEIDNPSAASAAALYGRRNASNVRL